MAEVPKRSRDDALSLSLGQKSSVAPWFETQRLMLDAVNPPVLKLFQDQAKWLKQGSGAAAVLSDFGKAFPNNGLPPSLIADISGSRLMLEGLRPLVDEQLRALSSLGAFGVSDDVRRACAGLSRLVAPFEISSMTRDILGVSSAIASISSIGPSIPEIDKGIAGIASRALDSWRVYIDGFPEAVAPIDLSPAGQRRGR